MIISIDTSAELSELERSILGQLIGAETPVAAAPAAPVKATPAPAKKAAAKKTAAPAKAPEPDPEPEDEGDDDLLGGGDDGDEEITMDAAVTLATELIDAGEQAKVRQALAAVGAKRVAEVKDAKLADFIAALKG